MLCFVVLTNILLLTSLIAILSQSLTKVCDPKGQAKKLHPAFPKGDARVRAAISPIRLAVKAWKVGVLIANRSWIMLEKSIYFSKFSHAHKDRCTQISAYSVSRYSVFVLEVSPI